MAAVAVAEPAALTLTDLPRALALYLFSLLPVDARACAACVCRGWRHVTSEPSLWMRLDLSRSSGVAVRVTDAVLAGAAAKARGQLAALDVLDCARVSFEALLAVVQANGGALRELRVGASIAGARVSLNTDRVERLRQAAPLLTAFHADVRVGVAAGVSVADARRMLRNEPPFQPLRLHALSVRFPDDADEASVLTLAADLAAHASLQRVELHRAPLHTLAALDAVVYAALARQLKSLQFLVCRLSPASAPALARLLGGATLTELQISQPEQLLDAMSMALLGAALRANSTLTSLFLCHLAHFWGDVDAAAALLSALTGHASLRTLMLFNNRVDAAHNTAAGAALGALVAANTPALMELRMSLCNLGDAGLRPLFEALPANTHLRALDVALNGMSEAFARDLLLPAVRANTSLQTLRAASLQGANYSLHQAEALVAERAAAA
jgi:hypothetical protein